MGIVKIQGQDIIQDTKKQIVNIARQLFSDYSYLGVSMSDIAKKVNITKGALYYHFTGKVEIYQKVLDEVFIGLSSAIIRAANEKDAKRKIFALVKNYLDFGFKEKNLIKALTLKLSPANRQISEYIIKSREQTIDLIQPIIKEVFANKKAIKKIDSRMLSSLLMGMMDGLLLEYSLLNKKINSEKVSNQIITVLF
ncbi:TetR/AcrR family transcriptional regulator [Candidatus Parcubacteria bacterium]|nr:TetR/AcrR family transcriptional regulator [Candidatus Parcubacteria bacterium]